MANCRHHNSSITLDLEPPPIDTTLDELDPLLVHFFSVYTVMGQRVGGLQSARPARPRVMSERRWQEIGWVRILIMARTFLWLGWPMSIYRELFARQIDFSCTHFSSIYRPIYCIIDLPTDQTSRSSSLVLARLCYWP